MSANFVFFDSSPLIIVFVFANQGNVFFFSGLRSSPYNRHDCYHQSLRSALVIVSLTATVIDFLSSATRFLDDAGLAWSAWIPRPLQMICGCLRHRSKKWIEDKLQRYKKSIYAYGPRARHETLCVDWIQFIIRPEKNWTEQRWMHFRDPTESKTLEDFCKKWMTSLKSSGSIM